MPPLNLDLLRAGNDAEWQRAWDELGLWNLACAVVCAFFVERRSPARPQFVEDVASQAMAELVDAIKQGRVNHTRGIKGMLRTIASNRAIDRLRRQWFTEEVEMPYSREGDHDSPEEDVGGFVRGTSLVAVLQEGQSLETTIEEWAGAANLDLLEKALFREHMVYRHTQQEFADAHDMALGNVGRLKDEVKEKLRELLRDEM